MKKVFRGLMRPLIIYNLASTISIIVTYIFENRKYKAMKNVRKGFKDHRLPIVTGDASSDAILKRITSAYLVFGTDSLYSVTATATGISGASLSGSPMDFSAYAKGNIKKLTS